MKPSDQLTDQEQDMIDLLKECKRRIEALHDANLTAKSFRIADAKERLHNTCKALTKRLPDWMW